jgi:hypothetical protein
VTLLEKQGKYAEAFIIAGSIQDRLQDDGNNDEEKRKLTKPTQAVLRQVSERWKKQKQHLLTSVQTRYDDIEPFFSEHVVHPALQMSLPLEMISTTPALWFVLKRRSCEALVQAYYGHAHLFPQLQAQLDQEFSLMKPQPFDPSSTISRRQLFIDVASLPIAYALSGGTKQWSALQTQEEFLPCCAASISACWHLLRGSDFAIAEEILTVTQIVKTKNPDL